MTTAAVRPRLVVNPKKHSTDGAARLALAVAISRRPGRYETWVSARHPWVEWKSRTPRGGPELPPAA